MNPLPIPEAAASPHATPVPGPVHGAMAGAADSAVHGAVNGAAVELYRERIVGHDLVLYDGVCALCNGVVRYLLQHDAADRFRFIPQETALAQQLLPPEPGQAEGVIVVTDALTPQQRVYRRSDAVAQAMTLLGGSVPLLGRLLRLVPRSLRELGYGWIARFRYRLFGRYASCPIPTPAQRSRILGLL